MSNPISSKIQDYVRRLREYEEKEDFDAVLQLISDYQTFLDGVLAKETNEMDRRYYVQTYSSLNILRRVIRLSKNVKKKDEENMSDFNNLKARVKRLEERFDALDSGK